MKNLGVIIDDLHTLREDKRFIEEQLKNATKLLKDKEIEVMAEMDLQGMLKGAGLKASVSITSSVQPSVEDWDLFYAFIHRHKYYHLLERRPAVLGCRELFETKGAVPGVVPYTQRKLNIRST